jgi:hypothetical protein
MRITSFLPSRIAEVQVCRSARTRLKIKRPHGGDFMATKKGWWDNGISREARPEIAPETRSIDIYG